MDLKLPFGVVAILFIILLIYYLFSYNKSVMETEVINEFQNINTVVTELRGLRTSAGYGPEGTDLGPVIINLNLAPLWKMNGHTLEHSWNGSVKVKSTGTSFLIEYDKVPKKACAGLVTQMSGKQLFDSINVLGGDLKKGKVSLSEAEVLCDASGENTLIFTASR